MNDLFKDESLITVMNSGIVKNDETKFSLVFINALMVDNITEDKKYFQQVYINMN